MPRFTVRRMYGAAVAVCAALLLATVLHRAGGSESGVEVGAQLEVGPLGTIPPPTLSSPLLSPHKVDTRSPTRAERQAPPRRDAVLSRFARDVERRRLPRKLRQVCSKCRVSDGQRPPGQQEDTRWTPPLCQPESWLPQEPGSTQELEWQARLGFGAPLVGDGVHLSTSASGGTSSSPLAPPVVFSAFGARFFGPGGQEYVWESIRQWRVFHPVKEQGGEGRAGAKVYVLVSSALATNPLAVANATALQVQLVPVEPLLDAMPQYEWYNRVFYVQGYMHPGGSRKTGNKDFNRLVTARFHAIAALMRREDLQDVVHLENDVMVYGEYGPLMAAWREGCGGGMATFFPSAKGAIPGVLFIRDADVLLDLVQFINELLSCGPEFGKALTSGYANDMTYLMNYYELRGAAALGELPTDPRTSGRENCFVSRSPKVVFDGASWGQWYSFALSSLPPAGFNSGGGGNGEVQDPTHQTTVSVDEHAMAQHVRATGTAGAAVAASKPPAHIQNAMKKGRYFDATPGKLLLWSMDPQGRRVPLYGEHTVAALHIHAKNLFWFRSR